MDSINRLDTIWCRLAHITAYQRFVARDDLKSFLRRAAAEGDEFRIRSLASLRRCLLSGLETGKLDTSEVRFGSKRGTSLPRFLYGAWITIFSEDGTLRAEYDALAVACINQLTAVFSKLPGSYPKAAEEEVVERFRANEEFLGNYDGYLVGDSSLDEYIDKARRSLYRLLCNVSLQEIDPKHGPGSSACGVSPLARWYTRPRYDRKIDRLWPYGCYFTASGNHLVDILENGKLPPMRRLDKCAKVLLVPKDYRGPRMISAEPRELMYIQQGVMWRSYNHIEAHPATRGHVNFTDQSINQRLAYEGSLYRILATLDLKDASDLISMRLVRRLFPKHWTRALSAIRSTRTRLPDGSVVRLYKHAPMGSACCFPVMALVIWALSTAIAKHKRSVYVYGDDLVCHVDDVANIRYILEYAGLRLNVSKCFSKGPFRESCGKEYCGGADVTPVYLRDIPSDEESSQVRLVTFANQLRERYGDDSYPVTCQVHQWYPHIPCSKHRNEAYWDNLAPWLLTSPKPKAELPLVLWDRYSDTTMCRKRWNRDLQVTEFLVPSICPRKVSARSLRERWGSIHRFLLLGDCGISVSGMTTLPKRVKYAYTWKPLHQG